jgi:hypothetical protein
MIAKAGFPSFLIMALASFGLVVYQTDFLDCLSPNRQEQVRMMVDKVFDMFEAGLDSGPKDAEQNLPPGPTYVIAATVCEVMGLDREGRVTMRDTACGCFDLPVLTGLSVFPTRCGENVSSPEVVVGLSIVRAFERTEGLLGLLSEVNLKDTGSPRAVLSGGLIVELGQGDLRRKLARLAEVLIQLEDMKADTRRIDLRFGGQVVVDCGEVPRRFEKEV